MTTTDTDFRRTVTDGCARDAATVHELLCVDPANQPAVYDGSYTITVGKVSAVFGPRGTKLTFPDPILSPEDAPVSVTVTADYTFGAMHTLVTALSAVVNL